MRRYMYCYQTVLSFGGPVTGHSVLLRCVPREGGCLRVESHFEVLPPGFSLSRGVDAFGNSIIYGMQDEPHRSLAYVSAGVVSTGPYGTRGGGRPSPLYLQPTRLTMLPRVEGARRAGDAAGDAMRLCSMANGMLEYAPEQTSARTTAADALRLGKGVCQDYAHVFIALCRQAGLPARYVCGFIEGTGQTHAWAEVHDGGGWAGVDPTHNRMIEYGYVKVAHGRDAADCDVIRGMYGGGAGQRMQASVTLAEV